MYQLRYKMPHRASHIPFQSFGGMGAWARRVGGILEVGGGLNGVVWGAPTSRIPDTDWGATTLSSSTWGVMFVFPSRHSG